MIQRIRNLIYECFDGKYEGVGQAIAGTALFAGIMYGMFSFGQKQDYGYWILKDTPKEVQVEFEPGLQGYDTNRDGNLDRLVTQIASFRPPILLENDVPAESDLFKKMNKVYNSGFSRDTRINRAGSE
jgi:hypothetical protein